MITEPLRSYPKRGGPGVLPIVLENPGPRFT